MLVRGYKDGKRFKEEVFYDTPYLFTSTKYQSEYHLIDGTPVDRLEFNSIKEAKAKIAQVAGVSNMKLYGATDFKYMYLYDEYKGEIDFDFSLINVISIDIETDMNNGFGDASKADRAITDLTMCRLIDGKSVTFSTIDYKKGSEDHLFVYCKNEVELLSKFLDYWEMRKWSPDIITGWNIAAFDIPVIVKRCIQVLDAGEHLRISPFGIVNPRIFRAKRTGKEIETFDIVGISILDYMEAYLKFAPSQREQYTLQFISQFELGDTKVDYSEYGSLQGLRVKNPELFVDYNIKDADLINRLEGKLHYLEQIVTMAYVIKCNYENILYTVKPWDILIINYLMDRNIVVPFFEESKDDSEIVGGYVKPPVPGLYEYVTTLDYTSLYPSVAMSFNISPDTIHSKLTKNLDVDEILHGDISKLTDQLKQRNFTITANSCLFKRDKRGFIPDIMKFFFEERKRVKDRMKSNQKTLQKIENELKRRGIEYK